MILADGWGAVGGIASVIAALAALVTIFYARSTVIEARKARQESSAAHAAAIREQREMIEVATTAHHEEMAERECALDSERALQKLGQIERVAETLLDLARTVREEHDRPAPVIDGVRMTMIPTVLARLRANVAIFDALGPEQRLTVASDLAHKGYPPGGEYVLVNIALRAYDEIESLVQNVPSFRPEERP